MLLGKSVWSAAEPCVFGTARSCMVMQLGQPIVMPVASGIRCKSTGEVPVR